MTEPTKERRKQLRAKGTPGLTVGVEPNISSVQVKDVSLAGLCFTLDQPLEFMTRLSMTLVLPGPSSRGGGLSTPVSVACEGAVVRCDAIHAGNGTRHEVAVFFTHLNENARKAIEDYVRTHG